MTKTHRYIAAVALFAALAYGPGAWAADSGSLDRIVDLYRNGAASWEAPFRNAAMGIFGLLVGIDVTWTLIRLGVKGADLGEFLTEMTNRIMFVGFFSFLLLNSNDLARAIIDSLRQVGNAGATASGGSGGISPSDIFDAGLKLATTVLSAKVDASFAGIGQGIALMIAALVVLICFGLMGAFLIVALVESYIVTSAGVILMGLGGSRWTKDFAVKGLVYAFSVGVKLFVIQLIAGLGESVIKGQAATVNPISAEKPEDVLVIVGFALVMMVLTKTIPDQIQGIISGTSVGNAGGSMLAGMVGGAVAGAAGGLAGAGFAAGNSMRLAGSQIAAEGGTPKLMNTLGRAVDNLEGAAKSDIGAQLGGRARGGSMPGRMGMNMGMELRELERASAKPMAPVNMASAGPASSEPEGVIRPGGGASSASGASGATQEAPSPGAADGSSEPGENADVSSGGNAGAAAGQAEAPPRRDDTVRGAGQGAAGASSSASTAAPGTGPSAAANPQDAEQAKPARDGLGARMGGSGARPEDTIRGAGAKPKDTDGTK